MPHRNYRVWIKGHPHRWIDWSGSSLQEAVIGAAVHLLTSEERQQMSPETTFCASRAMSITVRDLDAWLNGKAMQTGSAAADEALTSLLRHHLHGTF